MEVERGGELGEMRGFKERAKRRSWRCVKNKRGNRLELSDSTLTLLKHDLITDL